MQTASSKLERGFSLLELLFAIVIVSIILGLTFTNLRHTVELEGPRGLAYSLAADLRAARAEAQKTGRLVAVCFPSEHQTNSLSRSFAVRKGDQRGHLRKVVHYGGEFDATMFLGQWESPPDPMISETVPDAWAASTSDELAIFFRPDGSAFSNDLFPVDGAFPILVGSSFVGTTNGASAQLTQTSNPHTVWVSSSGTVEVDENKVPVGVLPKGESPFTVAELDLGSEPPPSGPTLVSARFLPEKIEDLPSAYVGQNYISIHPDQKEGEFLEYGLATIELKVRDNDGGPLRYTLEATATSGGAGEFSVPEQEGPLRYVFDEALNDHIWYGLVSWRPPPGAPEDTEYSLTITVADPDGNLLEIATEAELLPQVTSLPPSRLVMCTQDDNLYLANLDGSNEVHITRNGAEYSPFFSADGSHIFSFHDVVGNTKQLRSRTSDGTTVFSDLCTFTADSTSIRFDPTFTFAAVTAPNGTISYPWGRVDEEEEGGGGEDDSGGGTTYTYVNGSNGVSVSRIFIVNLMSNDTVGVSETASSQFHWNTRLRHAFYFNNEEASPEVTDPHAPGPFHVEPGHVSELQHLQLVGYPSATVGASGPRESAYGKVYNPAHRDWYLEVAGSSLRVRNDALSVDRVVDTSAGGFENDPNTHRTPTWSANGRQVAYVKLAGSDPEIHTRSVLNSDLTDALSTFSTNYSYSAPGLKSAQLSPRGKWVYFLRGQSLFRARNSSSSPTPANISSHLGKGVKSYVLSP